MATDRWVDGKPAGYLYENFTRKAPVTDPNSLRKLLSLERGDSPNRLRAVLPVLLFSAKAPTAAWPSPVVF